MYTLWITIAITWSIIAQCTAGPLGNNTIESGINDGTTPSSDCAPFTVLQEYASKIRQQDEIIESLNRTNKQQNETIKRQSEANKQQSKAIKQLAATNKQHSVTIREHNETIKQKIEESKQQGEIIKQLTETIKQLTKIYRGQSETIKQKTEGNKRQGETIKQLNETNEKCQTPVKTENALPNIPHNVRWAQKGGTVAGGHEYGSASNQLNYPHGLYVDEDQTVFIADYENHRIMEWKRGDTSGRVVAGGKGQGSRTDQLNGPTDVIVDKEKDSLVICDYGNRRVMQWSRQSGTTSGKIIIDNVDCARLTLDDERFLYVSDYVKHEGRRYRMGEKTKGIVVAGGNGAGAGLNQLNSPRYVFVDREHSVYVSDENNHRVMKWVKGAKEGIVVAGGRGEGNELTQLSYPQGVFVDSLGTVYVTDSGNNRVMRWHQGATQGTVVVGGNRKGKGANQLNGPLGLSFDRQGNLYVVDWGNHRVQRFSIETS